MDNIKTAFALSTVLGIGGLIYLYKTTQIDNDDINIDNSDTESTDDYDDNSCYKNNKPGDYYVDNDSDDEINDSDDDSDDDIDNIIIGKNTRLNNVEILPNKLKTNKSKTNKSNVNTQKKNRSNKNKY